MVRALLLAFFLPAFLLGGCGDDENNAKPASEKQNSPPAKTAANADGNADTQIEGTFRVVEAPGDRAENPRRVSDGEANPELEKDWPIQGKVVIRAFKGCSNLNPLTAHDPVNVKAIGYQLNMNLVVAHPEEVRPMPWLAESMPQLEGKRQVWTLRQGTTWSDGVALTSADAVHAWDLLRLPALKSATSHVWSAMNGSDIASIEALDARRFAVTFKDEATAIDAMVFGLSFPIVPKHAVPLDAKKAAAMKQMPGSGPYVVEVWNPKQSITFKRVMNWWGDKGHAIFKNRYRLERIVRKVVTDNVQIEEQLINGLVDLAAVNSPNAYVRLEGEPWDENFNKAHYYLSKWSYIGWNCQHPLFEDARVRRALGNLVPRSHINEQRYHGLGHPVSGPFFADSPFSNPKIRPLRWSDRRAKKHLADAGWKDRDGDGLLDKDGKPFEFTMLCQNASNAWAKAVLEPFAETLRQVGISMTVEYLGRQLYERAARHENAAYILIWDLDALNPDLKSMMHSSQAKGGYNWQNFLNADLDHLLEQFTSSGNEVKRIELAHKIHMLLYREQPITFLFTNPSCIVWNKRVKNVLIHPLGLRVWDLRVED